MTVQQIDVGTDKCVLVPFTVLDSFGRTYENFRNYARRKGYKEFVCKDMLERTTILRALAKEVPTLRCIAFGESLPAPEWDEETKTFLLARFQNGAKPRIQAIPVDMTLCEDEYDAAVCIFRT